jgi:hypothetical protein
MGNNELFAVWLICIMLWVISSISGILAYLEGAPFVGKPNENRISILTGMCFGGLIGALIFTCGMIDHFHHHGL